ncbi:MAG: cell cycle histidine kinase CckA [Beijerinckiaceae bacterium]
MASPPPVTSLERPERGGSFLMLMLIAGLFVGVAVAAAFLATEHVRVLIVAGLSLLAVTGIVALFGFAIGFFQLAGRGQRNDLSKAIADSAPEATVVVDHGGRILYANEAYARLAGATSFSTLVPVERLFTGTAEVSEAVYRLAQAAREGKIADEEMRVAVPGAADGEAAWYRVRVRPLPRSSGSEATLWKISDVTHDRERHENFFQVLQTAIDYLDHAPVGFLSIEPDGRVAHINATLAGWLDQDLASFAPGKMAVDDLFTGANGALLYGAAGHAGDVSESTLDLELKKRNGRPLPVRVLHTVAYGSDGQPGASRTIILNQTPGAETGSADGQRAADVRFARFFNATPMAIASVARDGSVTRHNAAYARMMAAARGGASQSVRDAVADRDRDALVAAIQSAADGSAEVTPLDLTLAGDGSRTARFFINRGDEGDGGQPEAAVVYALETTEQRTLEQKFAQAQKMQALGQLAGGIAHDFNNVLQAIIGYSDLLLANHRATDPSFPDIMQIKQNANRAAGLVRQLLAFSRRQTLRPRVIAMGDALADLTIMLKRLLGERVELDLRHGRDLWPVKADVNQFEQVVVNLAVNARDAMPHGGKLAIRTSNVTVQDAVAANTTGMPPGDYVLLEVKDTGTGITADVLEKIFDPFFTTKEVGKGTGLGLSTVYGIIKQTGGFIYCDSEVGEGTTFRIYLPKADPAEEEAEAPPPPDAAKPKQADLTGQGTILLVEDEEAVRRFAERALMQRGYKVLVATNGAHGLEVAQAHEGRIDLVLSDVVMPEMDGPSMLRELRKVRPEAKVIFMSGHAEDAFEKSLDPDEQFGFISKPFNLKDLAETVKKAISS